MKNIEKSGKIQKLILGISLIVTLLAENVFAQVEKNIDKNIDQIEEGAIQKTAEDKYKEAYNLYEIKYFLSYIDKIKKNMTNIIHVKFEQDKLNIEGRDYIKTKIGKLVKYLEAHDDKVLIIFLATGKGYSENSENEKLTDELARLTFDRYAVLYEILREINEGKNYKHDIEIFIKNGLTDNRIAIVSKSLVAKKPIKPQKLEE